MNPPFTVDESGGKVVIPDLPLQLRLLIRFPRVGDDDDAFIGPDANLDMMFIIPFSDLYVVNPDVADGYTYDCETARIVRGYLMQSLQYLHGSQEQDRISLARAIKDDEFNVTSVKIFPDTKKRFMRSMSTVSEEAYYDMIKDYLGQNDDGSWPTPRPPKVDHMCVVVKFTHATVWKGTTIVSPYINPEEEIDFGFGGDTAPLFPSTTTTSPPHDVPPQVDRGSTPYTTLETVSSEDIQERNATVVSPDANDPSPSNTSTTHWRNSPLPQGPWQHKAVARTSAFANTTPQAGPSATTGSAADRTHSIDPRNSRPEMQHTIPIQTPTPFPSNYQPISNSVGPTHDGTGYVQSPLYHPHSNLRADAPPYQSHYTSAPPPYSTYQNQPPSTQPPSDVFDPSEFGAMSPESFYAELNRTDTDLKNFSKKDHIPKQGTTSLINWYRRFTSHAMRYGVFVPPFESLLRNHKMGAWYNPNLEERYSARRGPMSQAILGVILNFDVLTAVSDRTRICNMTCGYDVLHTLMRPVHPALATTTLTRDQPRCRSIENISVYITNWHEYLLLEYTRNRMWRRAEIAEHIIANLPSSHSLWIKHHYESLMMAQGHRFNVPEAYSLPMIGYTIESMIELNPNVPTSRAPLSSTTHHRSHALHDTDAPHDGSSDTHHVLHAVHGASSDSSKLCSICQVDSHELINCHKYINYCLCSRYATKNPNSVQQILAVHQVPPRPLRSGPPRGRTHALQSTTFDDPQYDDDGGNGDPDDDDPPVPSPEADVNHVLHSIRTTLLHDYHEDDDALSDDEAPDPSLRDDIASIDFDFDLTAYSEPPRPSPPVTLLDPVQVRVLHVAAVSAFSSRPFGGQFDPGTNMTTTNRRDLLWDFQELPKPLETADAGQHPHLATAFGYLVLPCTRDGIAAYIGIRTYYTPTIGVTLISPGPLRAQYPKLKTYVITDTGTMANVKFYDQSDKVVLAFVLYPSNLLQFTAPFVPPSKHQQKSRLPTVFRLHALCVSPDDTLAEDFTTGPIADSVPSPICPSESEALCVHPLHARTEYQLWHQRLGHIQPHTVVSQHKHADGVPTLTAPTILDNCPVCIASKMRRAGSSRTESLAATTCNQSISIDMGFVVTRSKNTARIIENTGLDGETCYILIACRYSGMLYGKALVSKAAPLTYFNQWLARYNPPVTSKSLRLDQGGELFRCRKAKSMFESSGYAIEPTGADSSHQNGAVERSHQSIGNMIRSLLHGADLPRNFWPYAFYHCLFILNRVPHRDKESPPITICSGQRFSLQGLRVFGCRVYVRVPGTRKAKLDDHVSEGIFLGYTETMKNIYWYDNKTGEVKIASHVRFDEGMVDLPDPPPNVKLLQRVEHDNVLPDLGELNLSPIDLDVDTSPFRDLQTVTITNLCDHPTFGFVVDECHLRYRAFLKNVEPHTSASAIRNIRHRFIGAYIVQINDYPIFDLQDADSAFDILRRSADLQSFTVILAPEKYVPVRNRREPMRINACQLRAITSLRNSSSMVVHSIAADTDASVVPITPDELRIKDNLTRGKLLKLATWPLWQEAEFAQLDAHAAQSMFGPPMMPPSGAVVLHPTWRYKIKSDGTRKARECCDGSPRAAPALHHDDIVTYASCVEQPCMRMFFAIASIHNLYVLATDAVNAYANAPGPTVPTYITVDASYVDWYYSRHKIRIDRNMVVRANHALQGHPEAGKLFESLMNDILIDRIGLTSTAHERNIYSGMFQDCTVYVCRQVDDLAIAAPTIEIGRALIAAIGVHVQLAGDSMLTIFNGVQVEQSSDYIRLHCEDYIDRLLARHGWSTPTVTPPREPMNVITYKAVDDDIGPPEHSPEANDIAMQLGFSYRQLLGELMYAYVVCRPDIGFALSKLSQYSTHPGIIHYQALKHVALYLRGTKAWGIMYWRPVHMPSLPRGSQPDHPISTDLTLPSFPVNHPPTQLVAFVDAAHATAQNRRSVTGFVLSLCGAAISYRSKIQTAVAISSTEAELVASVSAAKAVLYIRSVLHDLGLPQFDPTPIYEDNAASILIVNASKPTPRTRHIDIQYFAAQQWRARGFIILVAISTCINIADALTKALAWILHHRHARRTMGHHAHQYTRPSSPPPL